MGIITTEAWQCDNCQEKFIDKNDVLTFNGSVECGDKQILSECVLCYECALDNLFVKQDRFDEIQMIQFDLADTEDLDPIEDDDIWT